VNNTKKMTILEALEAWSREEDRAKEKPILMSSAMVRAILEDRKSQTRRVINPQPDEDGLAYDLVLQNWMDTLDRAYRCPYGIVGDRLYVREACRLWWADPDVESPLVTCEYVADGEKYECVCDVPSWELNNPGRYRSGRFMPRWASRITLEVTDVRVERLQEIGSDEYKLDVFYEGICETCTHSPESHEADPMEKPWICGGHGGSGCHIDAVDEFRRLWNSINGKKHPWSSNPWVFVISFRRIGE
jgi:hypothetical protein